MNNRNTTNVVTTLFSMTPNKSSKKTPNKNLINLLIEQDQEMKYLKLENFELQKQIIAVLQQSTRTTETTIKYGNSNNPLRRNEQHHP